MKWVEVRKMCPDTYVVLEELDSHVIDNMKYVGEVALVRTIEDSKEATRELVRSKGRQFVYHTANEEIIMEIVSKVNLQYTKYKNIIRGREMP